MAVLLGVASLLVGLVLGWALFGRSGFPLDEPLSMEVRGRNLIEGIPKTITMTDEEVREALEEGLGATGGAHLDADPSCALARRELAVRTAGRHLHRLALGQELLVPVDAEPHRPGDHLETLHLRRVHVTLREKAACASDHVEFHQLAAGLLGGPQQLHAHPEWIQVQHAQQFRCRPALGSAAHGSDHRIASTCRNGTGAGA